MDGKRWWLGAVVFGAVAAAAMTIGLLGAERPREAPTVAATPAVTAASIPPTSAEPPPEPVPEPAATPVPNEPGDLAALAEGIDVGVVVRDLDSGDDLASFNPDQEFDSASLVKILIALDALENGREPDATIVHMLSTSDDDEASRMWSDGGGGRIVSRWAKLVGLAGTSPPEDPDHWGDTPTTATDVAAVYRYLLKAPGGPVVLDGLDRMADFGADGFDQRFGIPVAAGARRWAVKQGWSCCAGHRTLHSTGLVGSDHRYVVVVLTGQPVETPVPEARARVTRIVENVLSGR
ncbi:serine hydrolase [Umezawaea sp. Da 62-37]|uniref:serine hydrolase n=1 Tax=Umezawaea sp. Da 62-37 TaxID=3075927 RepID=UPI0028F6E331|nr:serine hydrolase [Umezawaea sp. Da 62-37]WNV82259.1 serine hydrolase [Umezawaea sp. Da 62-37]